MTGLIGETEEERAAIDALRRITAAGFKSSGDSVPGRVMGKRRGDGVIDTYVVFDVDTAFVGRYLIDDHGEVMADPVWFYFGPVTAAITALLKLSPHGSEHAPKHPLSGAPAQFQFPPFSRVEHSN